MPSILIGQAASFTVTVTQNGSAIAIDQAATVTGQLFLADGSTSQGSVKTLTSTSPADWANGIVALSFTNIETGSLIAGDAVLTIFCSTPSVVKRFRVHIETSSTGEIDKSAFFIKDIIVDQLRSDQLLVAAQNTLPGVGLSDDYIWSKVLMAESTIKHMLRVPLVPTQFFPLPPSQDQINALNGMPWDIDPPYDYAPEMYQGDNWGYFKTRQQPIISISLMRYAYPAPTFGLFDIPLDWIRTENKYGNIQLVPNTTANIAPLNAFILTALGGGRRIPFMLQLTYIAGLSNAAKDYPELLDVIKKAAVLGIITDSFLPASGSISADGLSQSFGAKMSDYQDIIENIINGPKGSNAGLRAAIRGIDMMVMG